MYSLCGSSVSNLGEQACDKARGVLKKLLIFNGVLESADYADEDTYFAKLVTNSKLSKKAANKLFVMGEAQDLADNSEANKEGSLNLGFKTTLLEGKPGIKVKIFGGADVLKRYRTFNNQTVRIIEYDANGVYWQTKSGTQARGFLAKIFVTGGKLATGQNVEEGVLELTISYLSTSEYFDNAFWVESTGNVEDIKPLIDVPYTFVSKASNVYKIAAKILGSNLIGPYSILPEVGTALAAVTHTAGSGTGYGTSLAIDTVTYNAAEDVLVFTFNSTAFGLLAPAASFKLIAPTPADLDLGDVPDTEVLDLILTK